MSDEVRKAVEKVEKRVKLLAADVGNLTRRADRTDKLLERIIDDRKELDASLRSMAASQFRWRAP